MKESRNDKHKVVVLVGSTKFENHFHKVAAELYQKGYIVLMTHHFSQANDEKITDERKAMYDSMYMQMMDMATNVYVINPCGYIGKSTINEIAYAKSLGLPIDYMENVE